MTGRAADDSAPVPARCLRVLVGELTIEDGQTPPPRVGEVGQYRLTFREAGDHNADHEPDATVSTIRARAEPLGDGAPLGPGRAWDGTPHDRPPVWPTVLRGDGWTATWSAPRPLIGEVELRGVLVDDLDVGVRTGARGLVTRVRVVTETIDTSAPDQRHWRVIPTEQRLREVDTAPRWFDRGLIAPPDAPTTGWYSPVPDDPYRREVGVLIDLDLDHVSLPPLRPSIVPGAISAHGPDLWVVDARLPLLVRVRGPLSPQPEVSEFSWPGRIIDPDRHRPRTLHAHTTGCWITDPDGLYHVDTGTDDDTAIQRVDEEPAGVAVAVQDGVLLVGDQPDPDGRCGLRLITPRGIATTVDLGGRLATAAVPGPPEDGFVLLLRRRPDDAQDASDRRPSLARLSVDGELRDGPPIDVGREFRPPLFGGDPLLVHADDTSSQGRLHRAGPDLALDESTPMLRMLLGAWAVAGRVWVATHPPHPHDIARRGLEACWPLPGPPHYPEDRQYWLLTELDHDTLDPITSTLVQHVPDQLAVAGGGTVWVLADGVRHLPDVDGAAAAPLDIADLLDRARTDPRPESHGSPEQVARPPREGA